MKRWLGFTLIELVIGLLVIGMLMSIAMPSFSRSLESYRMKRIADEVEQLFILAKTEAVMRPKGVWIHYSSANGLEPVQEDWSLSMQSEAQGVTLTNAEQTALHLVSGADHPNITISPTINMQLMPFDSVTGKPNGVARSVMFYIKPSHALKVNMHNITGRVRICGIDLTASGNDDFYGFEPC